MGAADVIALGAKAMYERLLDKNDTPGESMLAGYLGQESHERLTAFE